MLKVLIVDDERLARMELNRLLNKLDDILVVGEVEDGIEAINFINNHSVDLVFLDIKMPEMDGLEFARTVGMNVHFVFCTAYSEHAVDAYELNAFDYIVKPIMQDRLEAVINKARLICHDDGVTLESQYMPDNHGLLLKFGSSQKIVRLNEINRFESIGNHVAVYVDSGKSYIHTSLSKIEKKLDPTTYFKASRSDIIRIEKISRIEEGMAIGSLQAIMESGVEIPVSRRQAHSLRKLFSIESF